MSSSDRHALVMDLFDELCELDVAARVARLDEACADDPELRAEVESLLAHDATGVGAFCGAEAGAGANLLAETIAGDAVPERIGPYRVVREIGRGGMGLVFEAEQENPRRRVAVKIVRQGFGSAALLRRFRQEAHVLGQLRHPGIAQIYEAGTSQIGGSAVPYFAMELVEGEPLDVVAKELGIRERAELIARVADAVQHAHQKGVIHRDLKPANIQVVRGSRTRRTRDLSGETPNGTGASSTVVDAIGQPKILDFGIARLTDSDIQATTIQTQVGQIVGTLGYMSPEQIAGDSSALDTRCDVYALGVMLYKLLCGSLPHELSGRSIAEAARIVREEEPRRLASVDSSLRGDLDTITTKAIEKDPDRRYATAAEMADDLRRYLRDEAISAHPPSAFYQLGKFARRNRGLVGGVAAAFLALVAGLVSTSLSLVEARAQRRIAEAQRDDLVLTQDWYTKLISRIDVEELGESIMGDLRERVRQGYERDDRTEEETQGALASLAEITSRANPTDVAVDALEAGLFDRARQSIEEDFGDRPALQASLFAALGSSYNKLGETDPAIEMFDASLAALDASGEADETTRDSSLYGRMAALAQARRNEEALEAAKVYQAYCRERFGADATETLEVSDTIAIVLNALGREEEAEKELLDALALHEAKGGGEDKAWIKLRMTLALVQCDLARQFDVEKVMQDIPAAARRVYGPEDSMTLKFLSEAGFLGSKMGRHTAALPLLQEAVALSERVLGHDHPSTLNRRIRLSGVMRSVGGYDEAAREIGIVIDARRKTAGEGSFGLAEPMRTLALIEFKRKRYAEALELLERAFPGYVMKFGENHKQTTVVLSEIGRTQLELERFEEAEATLRDARSRNVSRFGEDDPRSIMFAGIMAQALVARENYAEAAKIQTEELERSRRVLGESSTRTAVLERDLAFALNALGRNKEAEPLARRFVESARATKQPAATVEGLIELGAILLDDGRPAEALSVFDEATELLAAATPGSPGIPRTALLRGAARAALGEAEAVEEEMAHAFEELSVLIDKVNRARRAHVWAHARRQMANLYRSLGKEEEAARFDAEPGE